MSRPFDGSLNSDVEFLHPSLGTEAAIRARSLLAQKIAAERALDRPPLTTE